MRIASDPIVLRNDKGVRNCVLCGKRSDVYWRGDNGTAIRFCDRCCREAFPTLLADSLVSLPMLCTDCITSGWRAVTADFWRAVAVVIERNVIRERSTPPNRKT